MFKSIAIAALVALTTLPVLAASKDGDAGAKAPSAAQARQQGRMAACSKDAAGKKGDERKAFMKQCLSSKAAAPAEGRKAARTVAQ